MKIIQKSPSNKEKEGFNYEIELINNFNYELTIELKVWNRFFKMVFDRALPKLAHRGVMIDRTYGEIKEFDAPKQYHNIVMGYLKKPLKAVIEECKEIDKITIKTYKIKAVRYSRINDKWNINVIFEGYYEKI